MGGDRGGYVYRGVESGLRGSAHCPLGSGSPQEPLTNQGSDGRSLTRSPRAPSICLSALTHLVSRHPLSTCPTPGPQSTMVRSVSSGVCLPGSHLLSATCQPCVPGQATQPLCASVFSCVNKKRDVRISTYLTGMG